MKYIIESVFGKKGIKNFKDLNEFTEYMTRYGHMIKKLAEVQAPYNDKPVELTKTSGAQSWEQMDKSSFKEVLGKAEKGDSVLSGDGKESIVKDDAKFSWTEPSEKEDKVEQPKVEKEDYKVKQQDNSQKPTETKSEDSKESEKENDSEKEDKKDESKSKSINESLLIEGTGNFHLFDSPNLAFTDEECEEQDLSQELVERYIRKPDYVSDSDFMVSANYDTNFCSIVGEYGYYEGINIGIVKNDSYNWEEYFYDEYDRDPETGSWYEYGSDTVVAKDDEEAEKKFEEMIEAEYKNCIGELKEIHRIYGGKFIGLAGRFSNGESLYQNVDEPEDENKPHYDDTAEVISSEEVKENFKSSKINKILFESKKRKNDILNILEINLDLNKSYSKYAYWYIYTSEPDPYSPNGRNNVLISEDQQQFIDYTNWEIIYEIKEIASKVFKNINVTNFDTYINGIKEEDFVDDDYEDDDYEDDDYEDEDDTAEVISSEEVNEAANIERQPDMFGGDDVEYIDGKETTNFIDIIDAMEQIAPKCGFYDQKEKGNETILVFDMPKNVNAVKEQLLKRFGDKINFYTIRSQYAPEQKSFGIGFYENNEGEETEEVDEGFKDGLKKAGKYVAGAALGAGMMANANANNIDPNYDGATNPGTEYSEIYNGPHADEIKEVKPDGTVVDVYGNEWSYEDWQKIQDGEDPFAD